MSRKERNGMPMRGPERTSRKQSGFTLVEILIVVAIIAVLIAVSIPMMNSALERARCATDAANERAALGLASAYYSTGSIDTNPAGTPSNSTNNTYLYRVDNTAGSLVKWSGDGMEKGDAYGQCGTHDHQDKYLWLQVLDDGTVRLAWAKSPGGTSGIVWDQKLCGSAIR